MPLTSPSSNVGSPSVLNPDPATTCQPNCSAGAHVCIWDVRAAPLMLEQLLHCIDGHHSLPSQPVHLPECLVQALARSKAGVHTLAGLRRFLPLWTAGGCAQGEAARCAQKQEAAETSQGVHKSFAASWRLHRTARQ